MNQQKRPEVHLEVGGGFFRIPTENVIYNITVLETQDNSRADVPSGIVQVEKNEFRSENMAEPSHPGEVDYRTPLVCDDFYKDAVFYYSGEFSRLTADLTGFGEENRQKGRGGLDYQEVLGKLDQSSEMVDSVKQILKDIQEQHVPTGEAQDSAEGDGHGSSLIEGLKGVQANTGKLKNIVAELLEKSQNGPPDPVEQTTAPKEVITKTRYLFDLDTVFQTIYELCTNETVKEHSQNARAKAADIFDKEIVLDYVSERAQSYIEDDGFFSVPLTDVLKGLIAGCSDKKTANLLKNMNKQQADIFLDQFLPLEVPPKEEVEIKSGAGQAEDVGEGEQALSPEPVSDARLGEAKELIDSVEASLMELAALEEGQQAETAKPDSVGMSDGTKKKLGDASLILADIVTRITGAREEIIKSSLDPVSAEKPGRALEEIKNTAESLATCLANKKDNPAYLFPYSGQTEEYPSGPESTPELQDEKLDEEDGKQAEIDEMLTDAAAETDAKNEVVDDFEEQLEFAGNDLAEDDYEDDFGEASQDDIDKLLEQMGG